MLPTGTLATTNPLLTKLMYSTPFRFVPIPFTIPSVRPVVSLNTVPLRVSAVKVNVPVAPTGSCWPAASLNAYVKVIVPAPLKAGAAVSSAGL